MVGSKGWYVRLIWLTAAAARAQQAPVQQPVATFQSTTKLVQVSVIAQDQQGKPVADLAREEFQILDNGAPQEIRLFLADKPAPPQPEVRTPNTFTNQIADGGANGRSGYSVILFDNLNTGFEYTARARLKGLQALQAIPAGDRIAMYSLWCKFQVIREFTSDRDSLIQQLHSFYPAAGAVCAAGSALDEEGPLPRRLLPDATAGRGIAAEDYDRSRRLLQSDVTDQEMGHLADHLAGIPGRKNLIWIATQFPLGRAALQKLIAADVAVYPVDAAGSIIGLASEKDAHNAPFRALAAATGGVAYFDRDDIDTVIRQALDDGRLSYTLGFYRRDEQKPVRNHLLKVSVSRPGVALRYRPSYQIDPPQPKPANPVAELVPAMNRPVDATAIAIRASATRMNGRLDLSLFIDVASLGLELKQGLWRGNAEVIARFMTADALQAGDVIAETMALNLRPATYTSMLEKPNGAPYRKLIKIPPKAVELKLLVGNLATGKIGTLTIPLSEVKEQ